MMRAVVVHGQADARLEQVPVPPPRANEVLVRSHVAGVCRTDVDIASGAFADSRWLRLPVVLGHEWAGTVSATGEAVSRAAVGDRVVCEGMIPCTACVECRRGATHRCHHYDQIGFTRNGGYGEYVLAPERVVHRLGDGLSFATAALTEPASCVWRALERSRLEPGERLGVVGIGTLGALAILLSRLLSPQEVIGYGIREEELEFARSLGADRIELVPRNSARTDAEELDVVLETAGSVAAMDLAARLVRPGGRVVLLGIPGTGDVLQLRAAEIVLDDVELLGSCSYSSASWSRVVNLVNNQVVDLAPVVTRRLPLSDFETAFRLIKERRTVGKIVLEHAD